MKVRITSKEFQELHQMATQSLKFPDDDPDSDNPEYLLAKEFFRTLLFVSSARERINVLELIKRNIQIIDDK